MNILALTSTILCWGIIIFIASKLVRKQQVSLAIWKLILAILVGLFSFSLTFPFQDTTIKIAIFPLGVWILFALLRKREGAWKKYRKFAWLGFFSNYLFLAMSVVVMPSHQWIYPPEDVSTYIGAKSDIEIENLHPSAKQQRHVIDDLQQALTGFESATFFVDEWYNATYAYDDRTKVEERFPYLVIGHEPKWGSDIAASIYIERDGKGILVSTTKTQYYFRSEHSILQEGDEDE
ncbi:hypothetical protein [Lysinibacillus sp. LZ02]|uniref:hypothetical protein n=1 Tax=Lysinibacillus sp. LZ02 TaxID=3420668 RepID=UPI003D35B895